MKSKIDREDLRHKLVVEREDKDGVKREYIFDMPYQPPVGEAYDACHAFMVKLVEAAQEASEKAARQEGGSDEAQDEKSKAK